jgi:S-adenosylmethionine:diacylglycerol 3-amino-3-carboxypropyl transferase
MADKSPNQREEGGSLPLQMGKEGIEKKISRNAARVSISRSPISHMVGAEVCTSVNFLSFPNRRGRNY